MHFSTHDLAPKICREAVANTYGQHVKGAIDFSPDHPVAAEMWLRQVGGIHIAMVETSPVRISTPASDNGVLYLGITVAGGGVIDALGEARPVKAGDFNIMQCARPSVTVADQPSRILSIMVPHDHILHRLKSQDTITKPQPVSASATKLLQSYATTLLSDDGATQTGFEQSVMSSHIIDLAVLVLGGGRDHEEHARRNGSRAARREVIKADIRAHLANPDLSLDWLVKRHRLSASYIRSLFYDEGTSFTDFVVDARLSHVASLLRTPTNAHETIAAIVFLAGFNDISWFNKLFRRRFGMTPSEWRAHNS